MNISDYVKQMGTTRTTLYKKINAAGIDVNTLRDENGELTDEGLSTLSSLLDGSLIRKRKEALAEGDTQEETIEILQLRIATLNDKLTQERQRCTQLQQTINEMNQQIAERERQHADELRDILKHQQAIAERQLLTDKAGADGRGLFGRIHDFFIGTKKTDNQ